MTNLTLDVHGNGIVNHTLWRDNLRFNSSPSCQSATAQARVAAKSLSGGNPRCEKIRVAAAQFENRDNDQQYNLSRIEALAQQAVEQGAEIVSFHEGCIPGYSWIQPLDKQQLLDVAELVPDGPSVRCLCDIARRLNTGDYGGPART